MIDTDKFMKFEVDSRIMKNDLVNTRDIELLVDQFYAAVQRDNLIGPIFNAHFKDRWLSHHQILYRFWTTVLLRRPSYAGNPVPIHFHMNLSESHFNRWLDLWCQTVDRQFEGLIAERAKHRGKTIADSFLIRIKQQAKI